jgi:hypothetical protein
VIDCSLRKAQPGHEQAAQVDPLDVVKRSTFNAHVKPARLLADRQREFVAVRRKLANAVQSSGGPMRHESLLQRVAFRSEAERRGIPQPSRFDVPDRTLWERGYRAEAGRSLLPIARTLDDALAIVRAFADPVLDGTAVGTSDPASGEWRD